MIAFLYRTLRWLLPSVIGLSCLFDPALSSAQVVLGRELDDAAPRITLVTFGPGDEVHQYFGHNALIVDGGNLPQPLIYNYGMFSFGPGMIAKFLRGRLEFWVGVASVPATFDAYVSMKRDIRLVPLNLTPMQRRRVAAELARDARPENREYLYNHYDNNCSTRVRDVLDHALDHKLHEALFEPGRFTLRQHTRRYTQHNPVIEWLMMFGLNDSVDQPLSQWDEAFLPDELERFVMNMPELPGTGTTLAQPRVMVFDAKHPPPPEAPATRWPWMLLLGSVLGAMVVRTGLVDRDRQSRRSAWVFGLVHGQVSLVHGFLGALLVSLWFTDHLVSHGNENLFMCNPVSLLASTLTFGLIGRRGRVERLLLGLWSLLALSTLGLLIARLFVAQLDQDISLTATLFAPLNLAFALTFWLRRRGTSTA